MPFLLIGNIPVSKRDFTSFCIKYDSFCVRVIEERDHFAMRLANCKRYVENPNQYLSNETRTHLDKLQNVLYRVHSVIKLPFLRTECFFKSWVSSRLLAIGQRYWKLIKNNANKELFTKFLNYVSLT